MNEYPDPQQGPDEAPTPAREVPTAAWPPVEPDPTPTQQHPLTQPVPHVQPPVQPPPVVPPSVQRPPVFPPPGLPPTI